MALTTGSFGGGLGDANLAESTAPNVSDDHSPKAGAPVTLDQFGTYPVDRPSNNFASASENTFDYMGPDA